MLINLLKSILNNSLNEFYRKEKIDKETLNNLSLIVNNINGLVFKNYDFNIFIKNDEKFLYNITEGEIINNSVDNEDIETIAINDLKGFNLKKIFIESDFYVNSVYYSFDNIVWYRFKNDVYVNDKVYIRVNVLPGKKIYGLYVLFSL